MNVTEILAKPPSQELLQGPVPARVAYAVEDLITSQGGMQ